MTGDVVSEDGVVGLGGITRFTRSAGYFGTF